MKNSIKVGLIGYGHLGKWHAQKIEQHDIAELFAIVEPSIERQKLAFEAHPKAKIVSDLSEVIDELEAAIIATPTHLHAQILKQLLKAGVHVFCEKPLVAKLKELDEIEQIDCKGLVLQVGHSERFHQIWEQVDLWQPYVSSQCIIRTNRLAPYKGGRATDVDVIQDLMIHDLDLLFFLLKQAPVSVQAWGRKLFSHHWDYVTCCLEYKNGKTAFVTVGRYYPEEVRTVELISSKGSCLIDLFSREVRSVNQQSLQKGDDHGAAVIDYPKRDHLNLEQEAFYRSILRHSPPPIGLKEGAQVVRLMDRVLASLESGEKITL